MLINAAEPRRLGTPDAGTPRLRFETETRTTTTGTYPTRRLIKIDGEPAFELGVWCGTCSFLFERLEGSHETLSLQGVQDRLRGTLKDADDEDVLRAFGEVLPEGHYLPLLLQAEPRLRTPGAKGDYFSEEQVSTWGVSQFWGIAESPRTPYYRTFETEIDASAHLYEFVVPMVPPAWNNGEHVEEYVELMGRGTIPTAVAVSTFGVFEPAISPPDNDQYAHWCLTHFLLDGHHKLEAAAKSGSPVRLLSLLALDEVLAAPEEWSRLSELRSRPRVPRPSIT
ncbi:hypothetical protein [Streptomyces sp. NPDC091027]|uniref:hypothetical protein n=1 Tax=Streptomyces sp. NPDC091027 TaxID=3365971 RepID=UPI00382B82E9